MTEDAESLQEIGSWQALRRSTASRTKAGSASSQVEPWCWDLGRGRTDDETPMRVGDRVHLAADPTAQGRVVRILDAWQVRVYWLAHPIHGRRWTVERIEALERAAPIWVDEAGRPCPTVPCPRCGRPVPRMRVRARTLGGLPDWRPFQVTRTPSWCGHAIPMVALPRPDGWWEDVLVWEPPDGPLDPLARWEPPGSKPAG